MKHLQTIPIPLGPASYDILVGAGLLAEAGTRLHPLLPQRRVVVITDGNVAPLYLAPLTASLEQAGFRHDAIVLPPGEATKSFHQLEELIDSLLALKVERHTTLIALGGGVIGDLTGFAASIVLRGIPFVQVPTTLLSQVDSSVGGKTGINTRQGKNLVGTFYQPRLVLIDTRTLDTLPPRELRSGYAEVVKYGMIDDPGFFTWLETNAARLLAGEAGARAEAVARSCQAKAAVVAADEREAGNRALLNLGHTFGHALEAETGFGSELLHGEAVALGCALAFRYSVRAGLCPAEDAARVETHLKAVGLPTRLAEVSNRLWDAERLVAHMAQDKKVKDGRVTFVLARGIGQAFLSRDVTEESMRVFLRGDIEGASLT